MIITVKKTKSKSRKTCPKCGSKSIATIRWGLVSLDEILDKKYDEEKVFYGGCCIPMDDEGNIPRYHCKDCEYQW